MPEIDSRFDDFRPYRDDEVAGALDRLAANLDFLGALAAWRLPRLARVFPASARRWVAAKLRRQWSGLRTVQDYQLSVKPYLERMIAETVTALSSSGLERLAPGSAYLFIGNHRDIALDPAFVNYSLHAAGFPTVRIAIGENLLKRGYVADLMRLNKGFVVPRSGGERSRMQRYRAFRAVSGYIGHSVLEERQSVWLAQREGRAKDGIDRTSEAVIKMLAMSKGKNQALSEYLRALSVVPVAVAYEFDPCDALKAKELRARERTGGYTKSADEDDDSIAASIVGHKGRVHVGYGEPLRPERDSPSAVAEEIDAALAANYRLWPTAHFARRMLAGEAPPADAARFAARIQAMPAEHRRYALAMYANPLLSRAEREPAGAA